MNSKLRSKLSNELETWYHRNKGDKMKISFKSEPKSRGSRGSELPHYLKTHNMGIGCELSYELGTRNLELGTSYNSDFEVNVMLAHMNQEVSQSSVALLL